MFKLPEAQIDLQKRQQTMSTISDNPWIPVQLLLDLQVKAYIKNIPNMQLGKISFRNEILDNGDIPRVGPDQSYR